MSPKSPHFCNAPSESLIKGTANLAESSSSSAFGVNSTYVALLKLVCGQGINISTPLSHIHAHIRGGAAETIMSPVPTPVSLH